MSIQKKDSVILLDNYLNVEALEDGLSVSLSTSDCEYCVDGDKIWIPLAAGATTKTISKGQILAFRASATPTSELGIGTFTISKKCNLKGNCMSLLFGDNAAENSSLADKKYAFQKLFYDCINIVEVSDGFLPATTLSEYCYDSMFRGCISLVQGPSLPASNVLAYSYRGLFRGCTSLTNAPIAHIAKFVGSYNCQYIFRDCTNLIDATQFVIDETFVGGYSLYGFFYGCKSLTNPTSFNITSMGTYALAYCFDGCTSLVNATSFQLSTTQVPNYGCYCMYRGCSSLIHGPALNAQMVLTQGMAYMFNNCTSLIQTPEIFFPNLGTCGSNAFIYMFSGCTNLSYIKMMKYQSSNSLYTKWVLNVAPTGTFVTTEGAGWNTGDNGIPSGWTRVNES